MCGMCVVRMEYVSCLEPLCGCRPDERLDHPGAEARHEINKGYILTLQHGSTAQPDALHNTIVAGVSGVV